MRKMVLLFNKMSFGQVLHLTTLLKTYLQAAHVHSNTDSHMNMEINGYTFKVFHFIALNFHCSLYCILNISLLKFVKFAITHGVCTIIFSGIC